MIENEIKGPGRYGDQVPGEGGRQEEYGEEGVKKETLKLLSQGKTGDVQESNLPLGSRSSGRSPPT